ncbi:MAG TPA: carbohydrate-binding family 9-like protein [Verrucomicrobiae bacterium]
MKSVCRIGACWAVLWLLTIAVGRCGAGEAEDWRDKMATIVPLGYVCHYTSNPIVVDGKLDDAAWEGAPWTSYFVDIQDHNLPTPRFRTRVKMLWDDKFLYIGAELEEPHVWATLTNHDSVIFLDPDFEVFMDPDWDTHAYYEFEMNALNTTWDLMLNKPYMDKGTPNNAWEIPGDKTAVHIDGTLNDPSDTDKGWTVEIAFPWSVLGEHARHPGPPNEGEEWRINFSRVEWHITTDGGHERKVPHTPEDNWVWSPQGVIDMHRPEMWGLLEFTKKGENVAVAPIPGKPAHDLALEIYYSERDFQKFNGRWATNLVELQWDRGRLPADVQLPVIEVTPGGYKCSVDFMESGQRHVWRIREDRLLKYDEAMPDEETLP